MSVGSHLPPEIRDFIVDSLHTEPETLKQCSLISKSWVLRTRKHLFKTITISKESDLEAWKGTFPDLANSPAYHTHTLSVGCADAVTNRDGEEGGWIRPFCNVVDLFLWSGIASDDRNVSLVPFHNFSPVLKSLRVITRSVPRSRTLEFACSFPLLEDLFVGDTGSGSDSDQSGFEPSTSPALTGTLELNLQRRAERTVRLLLSLPSGLHFRRLVCGWRDEKDISWTRALVEACSDTLECVDLRVWRGTFLRLRRWDQGPQVNLVFAAERARSNASVDFAYTPKLKEVVFRAKTWAARWMTLALQTIKPDHRHFHQISIYIPNHHPIPVLKLTRVSPRSSVLRKN